MDKGYSENPATDLNARDGGKSAIEMQSDMRSLLSTEHSLTILLHIRTVWLQSDQDTRVQPTEVLDIPPHG